MLRLAVLQMPSLVPPPLLLWLEPPPALCVLRDGEWLLMLRRDVAAAVAMVTVEGGRGRFDWS